MFKPQITNKLSYFVVVGFREIERRSTDKYNDPDLLTFSKF